MTLKRKMLLIIIPAIIIIIGFVSYYVIKKNDNQLRDLMKTEARYRGSSIKNGIEVATESTEKVAEALAVSIDIESDFNEDFIIKLIAANSKFFFNIQSCNICFLPNEVGFKTKEFIFNFDNNTFKLIKHNEKQITYLDKPWFLEPIKTDKPFWCDPYTTKDRPNDTKISYIVPIKRNNKNIGVITLNFLTIFIDIELERERQKILKKNQYLSDDTDIFMIATPEENKKNQVYRIIADSVFSEKSRIDKLLSENNILLKTIKETDQSISDTNQVQKISDFIIKYIVNYEPPENKTKTEKERKEERFNIHDIQLGNKIILSIPILDDLRLYTSGINNNKKKIVWYILIISSNEKANKEIQNAVIQTLLITLAILFLLIFIIVKTLDNSLKPI